MTTVITFGTFDVFHIGHLNILRRAATHGDRLVVGVSSDALNLSKKGRAPVYPETERRDIVGAIQGVSAVFSEKSLEDKDKYITDYKADVLVMGDDWKGKFDHLGHLCKIVYLPRTVGVSTTDIMVKIRKYG